MFLKSKLLLSVSLAAAMIFTACSSDDNGQTNNNNSSNAQVFITDAPVDNANVEGVFVTIADVKVDGASIEGFTKTTVEISALSNGVTALLGDLDLEAGTYNNVSLVLDNQTDMDGASPSHYVRVTGGAKVALETTLTTLQATQSFVIEEANDTALVIDFDLRKAIVADASGNGFEFASNAQLQNSIRVVNSENTGIVRGTFSGSVEANQKVVAYAYARGTFAASEAEQNANGVRFANAISSSVVAQGQNSFALHFLNQGDYEVRFASFRDTDSDGVFEFEGTISASVAGSLDLLNLNVQAQSETNLSVTLGPILFL